MRATGNSSKATGKGVKKPVKKGDASTGKKVKAKDKTRKSKAVKPKAVTTCNQYGITIADIRVNQTEMAALVGLNQPTLSALKSQGIVAPEKDSGLYSILKTLPEYIRHVKSGKEEKSKPQSTAKDDLETEMLRLKNQKLRYQIGKTRREIVERLFDSVTERLTVSVASMRGVMDTLPEDEREKLKDGIDGIASSLASISLSDVEDELEDVGDAGDDDDED